MRGVKGADTCPVESLCITKLLQNLVVPRYPRGGLFQDPLQVPKSVDAQVPDIKIWAPAVGPPHPQAPNGRLNTVQVFIEKTPIWFKAVLFKGQLHDAAHTGWK